MQTLQVDPRWLVDSFTFEKYAGADEYGGVKFEKPITVENCRIDYKKSYERNSNEVVKIGDGTIFCYGKYTTGAALTDLVEKSKVTIDGKPYTIKQVAIFKEVMSSDIFSVELVIL